MSVYIRKLKSCSPSLTVPIRHLLPPGRAARCSFNPGDVLGEVGSHTIHASRKQLQLACHGINPSAELRRRLLQPEPLVDPRPGRQRRRRRRRRRRSCGLCGCSSAPVSDWDCSDWGWDCSDLDCSDCSDRWVNSDRRRRSLAEECFPFLVRSTIHMVVGRNLMAHHAFPISGNRAPAVRHAWLVPV